MICLQAKYRDFRNISDQTIVFSPEVNVIYGQNAQGKTNALEGIYLMASGRCFRAGREREAVRFSAPFAELSLGYRDLRRESVMGVKIFAEGRRSCTKNGIAVRKMSEFIGNFRAVLFTPEHLSIVKEGPALRRSFLDCAICQLSPGYVAALQSYNRILLQRNRLLADIRDGLARDSGQLEIWTQSMAREAATVSFARARYVEVLSEKVGDIFADMTAGRERVSVRYRAERDLPSFLREAELCRRLETKLGVSRFGVHKDDLELELNELPVREYGSQGQQRSVALALKLAEGELSKARTGEYPVFLFDDILSELDSERKSYILSGTSGRQVLITSCEPIDALGARIIRCENGHYFY